MIRGKVFGRRVKISPLSFPSQPGRPKEPLYCGVGKTRNSDDGNDDDLVDDDDDDNQRHHLISLESKPIIQSSKSKQECFQLDKWHGGKNRQFSTFCFTDGGCWYFNIVIVIFIFKLMF